MTLTMGQALLEVLTNILPILPMSKPKHGGVTQQVDGAGIMIPGTCLQRINSEPFLSMASK